MLLRHFMTHVKNQNWMAVGVDFLVVVFGVFIGIQVDSWNQSRIEQREEKRYLELMIRDLGADLGSLKILTDAIEHHVDAAGLIIEAAEGGNFSVADMEPSFTFLYLTFDYTPPAPTYIGLRNGANLDLFRDSNLRSRIIDYYEVSQSGFKDGFVPSYRVAQADLHEHLWRYVRFRVPDDPLVPTPIPNDLDWTTLLTPITDAKNDTQFLNDLSEVEGRGAEILVVAENLEQENRNLQETILDYLN